MIEILFTLIEALTISTITATFVIAIPILIASLAINHKETNND